MAYDSDLSRTKNWGNEVLTDSDLEGQLDLIIAWVMAAMNSTTGHNHDGTSNHGPKLTPANLVIASQAQGDLLYASSASAWARLGAGTSGQFLKTQGAAANPAWETITVPTAAAQSDQETATSTTTYVSPGRQQYHPSALKFWGLIQANGTVTVGYNITSVVNDSTGQYTVTIGTDFSSGNYAIFAMALRASAGCLICGVKTGTTPAAGSFILEIRNAADTLENPTLFYIMGAGDQ